MDLEATKREPEEDLMEDPDGQYLAEVMGMTESEEQAAEQRDLALIEGEILFYKRQAGGAIIEIGRRLIEAKRQLEHGEWLPWLREKVDLSERSAQNFMRLAKEYSKSAEIADLGASKALALLALPPQERERFASEKHDVNGVEKTASEMTAREIKEAIAQRDQARKDAEEQRARAETAEESRAKMETDMVHLKGLLSAAQETAQQREAALAEAEEALRTLRERPAALIMGPPQNGNFAGRGDARERTEISPEAETEASGLCGDEVETHDAAPEQLEKARKEGAEEAEKAHRKALDAAEKKAEEQVKKLREELRQAQAEARQAGERLQEAENAGKLQKALGSERLVTFGVLFRSAQDTVNRMAQTMGEESEENRQKMRAALLALAEAIRQAAEAEGEGHGAMP